MSASPPNAAPRPEPDRLAGLVERVTFHNADSGFCVLRLKVKGERELITALLNKEKIEQSTLVFAAS